VGQADLHPHELEFNGSWYPWSIGVNGNTAADYVAAWRCPVESRGAAILNGDIIALTDPPPDPLTNVAGPWRLVLDPAAAVVHS
jgi:hypothetical protein